MRLLNAYMVDMKNIDIEIYWGEFIILNYFIDETSALEQIMALLGTNFDQNPWRHTESQAGKHWVEYIHLYI